MLESEPKLEASNDAAQISSERAPDRAGDAHTIVEVHTEVGPALERTKILGEESPQRAAIPDLQPHHDPLMQLGGISIPPEATYKHTDVLLRYELNAHARAEGTELEYVADLVRGIRRSEGLGATATLDDEVLEAVAQILARSARRGELRIEGLNALAEVLSDPDVAALISEFGDFFVESLGHDIIMGLPPLERFEGAALLVEKFQCGSEVVKPLKKQVEEGNDPIFNLLNNLANALEGVILALERKCDPALISEILQFEGETSSAGAASKLRAISERLKPHIMQRRRNARALRVFAALSIAVLLAGLLHVLGANWKFELVIAAFGALVAWRSTSRSVATALRIEA